METLTNEAPRQTEAGRPRRTWLIVLVAVLVVAGIVVGTWAIIEANQSDDLAVATEFADNWVEAVLAIDGEVAAALFTEDGVYDQATAPTAVLMEGRDNINLLIAGWAHYVTDMRHGEVVEVEDGVFAFPTEGVAYGVPFASEMTITLEGDLVSHARVASQGD